MSGPVGHTFIYNLIILFIVIIFGFLAGSMSYYKAFKINNRIVSAIEKFEGYNTNSNGQGSLDEINRILGNFGYAHAETDFECPASYKDMPLLKVDSDIEGKNPYRYCIYLENQDSLQVGDYYMYGVLTYMNMDMPFIDKINIPVFTRTNRIYKFTSTPSGR